MGLIFAAPASAATRTWGGGTGNWSVGANWGGTAPVAGDDVQFTSGSGTCTLDVDPPKLASFTVNGFTGSIAGGSRPVVVTGNYAQAGGAVSGLSSLTVGGNFTLSGTAAFTAPATLKVGGIFTRTAGTFTAGSGTLTLTSPAPLTHDFTGVTLNNLTIDDALVAHWPMDAASTASAVFDQTKNLNSLTTSGQPVPISAGKISRALTLAGGDYVELPDAVGYPAVLKPANWTISAWMKIDDVSNSNCGSEVSGVKKGADLVSIGNDIVLRMCAGNGNAGQATTVSAIMRYSGGTDYSTSSNTTSMDDTSWHHVAATYDGTDLVVYLDGTRTARTISRTQTFTGTGVEIGGNSEFSTFAFGGFVDDVRMYNRALTQAEVNLIQAGTAAGAQSASSNITVSGDLTLTSWGLAATNGISVGGSWINNGGRFSGAGTVTLAGSTAGKLLTTYGQRFGNVSIAGTGSGSWTLSDPLHVTSALNISGGTLSASSFTIRAGSMIQSGTGAFNANTGRVVIDSDSPASPALAVTSALNHLHVEDPTETGLVAYWKLDEGAGVRVHDHSPSGNHGTLRNAGTWGGITGAGVAPVTYHNPSALTFNGVQSATMGDAVLMDSVTNLPDAGSAQSLSAWLYTTALPDSGTGSAYPVTLSVANPSTSGVLLTQYTSGKIGIQRDNGTAVITSVASPSLNAWHHVAYTYDGATGHKLYLDGTLLVSPATLTNGTLTRVAGAITAASIGNYIAIGWTHSGRVDDVRVYNVELTQAEITKLHAGRYPGRGGVSTFTLGADTTVNGTFSVDSGTLATSSYLLSAAATDNTKVAYVNGGGLTIGSRAATFSGGLTVQADNTLTMNTTGGELVLGDGTSLILDGTFDSSNTSVPILRAVLASSSYTFTVGSTAVINVDGLAVQDVGSAGMNFSSVTSATFTKFDNVAFSSGTGTALQMTTPSSLVQHWNGFTADSSYTKSFKLVDSNNGSDTRVFVGGLCDGSSWTCETTDDDGADNAGVVSGGGSLIQWGYSGFSDITGVIQGFPASAFDMNTFAHHATYIAVNNGASDTLYGRDSDGKNSRTAWSLPNAATEDFVGPPRWRHSGGNYYVYLLTTAGRVYKLQDNGTSFDTIWTYRDSGSPTATSPLTFDSSNLYWAGNGGSGIAQITSITQAGSPSPTVVGAAPTATTTAFPSATTLGGVGYLFSATSGGVVYRVRTDFQETVSRTLSPASAVTGTMMSGWGRVHFVDQAGTVWSLSGSSSTLDVVWSYKDTVNHSGCTAGGSCAATSITLNAPQRRVLFGDKDGHLYSVYYNGTSGAAVSGFPIALGAELQSAPLYRDGVIAVGSTTGKMFFVDQQNASNQPELIRTYTFTAGINTISYDYNTSSSGEYIVSTTDGKIYYVSRITDPTPANN